MSTLKHLFCHSITIHINHITRRTTHVSPHIKWNDDLSTDGGLKCTALVLPGLICIFQSLTTFGIDWRSCSLDVRILHLFLYTCMYIEGSSMPIPRATRHVGAPRTRHDDGLRSTRLSVALSFLPAVWGRIASTQGTTRPISVLTQSQAPDQENVSQMKTGRHRLRQRKPRGKMDLWIERSVSRSPPDHEPGAYS